MEWARDEADARRKNFGHQDAGGGMDGDFPGAERQVSHGGAETPRAPGEILSL